MKLKSLVIAGACALAMCLINACSSYTYYAVGNANVSKYSTFAWLPSINNTKNPYFDNDLADEKIKDQATFDLQSRGLRLRSQNPDLLVRYTVMVDEKVKTFNEPQYAYTWGGFSPRFGYYRGGGYYYYNYGGAYPVYVGNEVYQVPYKEGTLVIDLIDRMSHKVIWRGYGIGEVDNPEKAINDLPKVTTGIFEKLQLRKM